MGADYTIEEIPANLVDEANEWRDKMLEKVAEFDDALMEKYFDDPSTITEEEVLRALRNATVQMAVVPMLCGSSFKNKGVQTLLDYVCAFLPSPLDTPAIIVLTLLQVKKLLAVRLKMKRLLLWHLRLQLTHT